MTYYHTGPGQVKGEEDVTWIDYIKDISDNSMSSDELRCKYSFQKFWGQAPEGCSAYNYGIYAENNNNNNNNSSNGDCDIPDE